MPGVSVTLDDRGLRRKVKVYIEALGVERLLKVIGLRQLGWVTENFEQQGALVGGWKPLSPNTVAGRRLGSSMILQDSGGLKNSFTPHAKDNVYDVNVGGALVTVGTKNRVAKFHEDGTRPYTIKPKGPGYPLRFMTVNGMRAAYEVHHPGLPQRRMLPTAPIAKKLAVTVMDAELEDAGRRAK